MDQRLRKIRHVALDMDGTIYKGSTLFDFSKPFLASLKEMGIGYTFLTNNPSKSVKDYLAKLASYGINATPDELYTSAQSTIEHLQSQYPKARRIFVLGTASMCEEFAKHGFSLCEDSPKDEPEVVVVGFDMTLSYARLCRAAWWLSKGKPFIATNPDRVCPTDQPTVLVDCGAICAALTEATGRKPDAVMGKPDPTMLRGILAKHSLKPDELAMVGDRIYTDVAMGHAAGALAVLVLTGEATADDAKNASEPPHLTVPSLKEFGEYLRKARSR
ncbi:MAG: HAD-IIA family hydrolase [Limisphaerales bacterium]